VLDQGTESSLTADSRCSDQGTYSSFWAEGRGAPTSTVTRLMAASVALTAY